jgi:hypothetical protein
VSSSERGSGRPKTRIPIVDDDSFVIDHLAGTLSLKAHEVQKKKKRGVEKSLFFFRVLDFN